ncbi:MAG: imidazoleglycerol-phosphate dehydratase HisB [Chloroflexi bacterium]|nr:imidazoleglycerol-phosphate dehydratase HisB [Chloroflexota bacterium]MCH7653030.1 imidazoleglycerol-phosphate dehydratase HisB [Chloroflexota bacterium]
MEERRAKLSRETAETQITVELNIDGTGKYEVDTGNGMFDHLLAQLSRHGLMDISVSAKGDTHVGWHHLVEDVGIMLGRALKEAVGDAKGITRMGHTYVPLDETLALTVVDFGGRGYSVIDAPMTDSDLGGLPADLIRHFLESLAREGAFNLHVKILTGSNNHHKAEAIFKSLARSLRAALTRDDRLGGEVPSTKGTIG